MLFRRISGGALRSVGGTPAVNGNQAVVMQAEDSASYRLCVAPMMDRTDRHLRYLLRLLAPHARLYTEMVTARALLHGDAAKLLCFDAVEHPVALQLGGNDPAELAHAARLGAVAGYAE